MNIFFKSDAHKARLLDAVEQLGKVDECSIDCEYGACLYILSANKHSWEVAQPYISRHGIRIDLLLKNVHHSTSEAVLVQLAGNLFNEQQSVNPVEMMCLDPDNFLLALSAIWIRRYGLSVVELS